ncbi:hypothetical protein C8R44DRAFT_733190 [Mycena epipterygia]|nr:hypothetical protein C8R44DRAFT_733190 [Mycena epipterygia]
MTTGYDGLRRVNCALVSSMQPKSAAWWREGADGAADGATYLCVDDRLFLHPPSLTSGRAFAAKSHSASARTTRTGKPHRIDVRRVKRGVGVAREADRATHAMTTCDDGLRRPKSAAWWREVVDGATYLCVDDRLFLHLPSLTGGRAFAAKSHGASGRTTTTGKPHRIDVRRVKWGAGGWMFELEEVVARREGSSSCKGTQPAAEANTPDDTQPIPLNSKRGARRERPTASQIPVSKPVSGNELLHPLNCGVRPGLLQKAPLRGASPPSRKS